MKGKSPSTSDQQSLWQHAACLDAGCVLPLSSVQGFARLPAPAARRHFATCTYLACHQVVSPWSSIMTNINKLEMKMVVLASKSSRGAERKTALY